MQRGEPLGGEKLDAYTDLLARRQRAERMFESERVQDELRAAQDWQRFNDMIDELDHQVAAGRDLDYVQRMSMDSLLVARDDVIARYPDPQGILNMKARHDQFVRTVQRETLRARAAAIAEHIVAEPAWLTKIGTQPTGRRLRETWREVVEDLARRYVDTRARAEMQHVRELASERAADTTGDANGDRLAQAWAEAQLALDAAIADRDNPTLFQASLDARRAAEQLELDSRPPWLTATLGERPADPRLAEQWDGLGSRLIALRETNNITDELDNGYDRAGVPLRQIIERFRIKVGLERAPRGADIDRGYGIGD